MYIHMYRQMEFNPFLTNHGDYSVGLDQHEFTDIMGQNKKSSEKTYAKNYLAKHFWSIIK